ncbi:hypothetical protein N0V90_010038 [Kalmusia sp. IMI 367209]|nr:hypothetical protein N0V90_010038 [Kalmusia sp. IMI 367209]
MAFEWIFPEGTSEVVVTQSAGIGPVYLNDGFELEWTPKDLRVTILLACDETDGTYFIGNRTYDASPGFWRLTDRPVYDENPDCHFAYDGAGGNAKLFHESERQHNMERFCIIGDSNQFLDIYFNTRSSNFSYYVISPEHISSEHSRYNCKNDYTDIDWYINSCSGSRRRHITKIAPKYYCHWCWSWSLRRFPNRTHRGSVPAPPTPQASIRTEFFPEIS